MDPFIPDLPRRRIMPWWVVGPSASEEEIISIKGTLFFFCRLFTSDLDICKSVAKFGDKICGTSLFYLHV
jgi:hypothetical protein